MAKPAVVKESAWPHHVYGIFTPNSIPGPCSAWHVSPSAMIIVWFYLWNDLFCFELCVYTCVCVWVSVHESRYPGKAEEGVGSFAALLTGIVSFLTWVRGWGVGAARRWLQEPYRLLPALSLSLSSLCDYALWGENRVAQWVFCLVGFERRTHHVILTGLAFTVECRPGWPQTHIDVPAWPPNIGIKGMHHHVQNNEWFLRFWKTILEKPITPETHASHLQVLGLQVAFLPEFIVVLSHLELLKKLLGEDITE